MAETTDYGRIIVLTGAGASAALGFPTMAEFPDLFASAGCDELRALADGMHWREKCKDLEYIYDGLELYAEAGRLAAEGDATLCRALGGLDSGATLCARARAALLQLDELILEHLSEVPCGHAADLDSYQRVLTELRELNGSPLRVFTANYDLALETMLPGNMIVDGFVYSDRLRRRVWSPTEAYREGPKTVDTRLVVYRLGGCSCWFRDERAGGIHYLRPLPKHRDGLGPVVAMPARSKVGGAFLGPFAYAYSALRGAMASAKLCVVIGYSLRDDSIADALSQAPCSMRFIVVDPTNDAQTVRRIRSVLDRFMWRRIQAKWGDPSVIRCLLRSCELFLREEGQEDLGRPVVPRDSCDDCEHCTDYGPLPPRPPMY